jgi:hypothetical protein
VGPTALCHSFSATEARNRYHEASNYGAFHDHPVSCRAPSHLRECRAGRGTVIAAALVSRGPVSPRADGESTRDVNTDVTPGTSDLTKAE